jgi:hypothetical protein
LAGAAFAAEPVREITYDPFLASRTVPTFDNGYLVFYNQPPTNTFSLYGPDGHRIYEASVEVPNINPRPSIGGVAVDTDGTAAVTLGYSGAPFGFGGGIALLDRTGRQTAFFATGRFMPSHAAFAADHSIWTIGWQRDATQNQAEDREDYMIFHHYSHDGKEVGAFLPRSSFPRGMAPGEVHFGNWRLRVTEDRVGALLSSGKDTTSREWVELDLRGNMLGRWRIDAPKGAVYGLGFTNSAQLYSLIPDPLRLAAFDRTTGTWKTLDQNPPTGMILGADGDNLIFYTHPPEGVKLKWMAVAK